MDHNYDVLLEAAIDRLPLPKRPAPKPVPKTKHYSLAHDKSKFLTGLILKSVQCCSASKVSLNRKVFSVLSYQWYMAIHMRGGSVVNNLTGLKPGDPGYDEEPFEWAVTCCDDHEDEVS
jgi:hypothetical protein